MQRRVRSHFQNHSPVATLSRRVPSVMTASAFLPSWREAGPQSKMSPLPIVWVTPQSSQISMKILRAGTSAWGKWTSEKRAIRDLSGTSARVSLRISNRHLLHWAWKLLKRPEDLHDGKEGHLSDLRPVHIEATLLLLPDLPIQGFH